MPISDLEKLLRPDGRAPVRDLLGNDAPKDRAVGVLREMLETGFLEVRAG